MLLKFTAKRPEEMQDIAAAIAKQFPEQRIWALNGDLGSGKTTFVKAFCKAIGIPEDVSSPTFSIVQEYGEQPKVYHFDLYRLKKTEELLDIGFEEYLEKGAYVFIEWPELAMPLLPLHLMLIRFEQTGENIRELFCSELIND